MNTHSVKYHAVISNTSITPDSCRFLPQLSGSNPIRRESRGYKEGFQVFRFLPMLRQKIAEHASASYGARRFYLVFSYTHDLEPSSCQDVPSLNATLSTHTPPEFVL